MTTASVHWHACLQLAHSAEAPASLVADVLRVYPAVGVRRFLILAAKALFAALQEYDFESKYAAAHAWKDTLVFVRLS